jgi:hypothetical protein
MPAKIRKMPEKSLAAAGRIREDADVGDDDDMTAGARPGGCGRPGREATKAGPGDGLADARDGGEEVFLLAPGEARTG